jgi:hypothetical protein
MWTIFAFWSVCGPKRRAVNLDAIDFRCFAIRIHTHAEAFMSDYSTPRFGKIDDGVRRSGLSRVKLYELATRNPGLFRKLDSRTIVDLKKLDAVLGRLPAADVRVVPPLRAGRRAGVEDAPAPLRRRPGVHAVQAESEMAPGAHKGTVRGLRTPGLQHAGLDISASPALLLRL